MRRFPFFVLLLLGSCATGPSVQSRLAAYTGASAETLVHNLGVPDKQITLNGVQYLAYSEHHTQITPGALYGYAPFLNGPFYNGGYYGDSYPTPFFGSFPLAADDYSCETTFMLRNDKVTGYTLRGNDCS